MDQQNTGIVQPSAAEKDAIPLDLRDLGGDALDSISSDRPVMEGESSAKLDDAPLVVDASGIMEDSGTIAPVKHPSSIGEACDFINPTIRDSGTVPAMDDLNPMGDDSNLMGDSNSMNGASGFTDAGRSLTSVNSEKSVDADLAGCGESSGSVNLFVEDGQIVASLDGPAPVMEASVSKDQAMSRYSLTELGSRGHDMATGEGGVGMATGDGDVELTTGDGDIGMPIGDGDVGLTTGDGDVGIPTDGNVDLGENLPLTYSTALMLNKNYQQIVMRNIRDVEEALEAVASKMTEARNKVLRKTAPGNHPPSVRKCNHYPSPYFTDVAGMIPAKPPDAYDLSLDSFQKDRRYDMFSSYESASHQREAKVKKLQRAVSMNLLRQALKPLESRKEIEMGKLSEAKSQWNFVQVQSIERTLQAVQDKMAEIEAEFADGFLPEDLDGIDWDDISVIAFGSELKPENLEAFWLNYAHPAINREKWTPEETTALKGAVKKHGMNNWVEVTMDLKNGRSPFLCLKQYMTNVDEEEPEQDTVGLTTAVKWNTDKDGQTNWSAVADKMGRRAVDCAALWKEMRAKEVYKTGRWYKDEDERLVSAIKRYGVGIGCFKQISSHVETRSATQCRERWLSSHCGQAKMGKTSKLEDSIVWRNGTTVKRGGWAQLSQELLIGRTDNKLYQRFRTLKALKKKGRKLDLYYGEELDELIKAEKDRLEEAEKLQIEGLNVPVGATGALDQFAARLHKPFGEKVPTNRGTRSIPPTRFHAMKPPRTMDDSQEAEELNTIEQPAVQPPARRRARLPLVSDQFALVSLEERTGMKLYSWSNSLLDQYIMDALTKEESPVEPAQFEASVEDDLVAGFFQILNANPTDILFKLKHGTASPQCIESLQDETEELVVVETCQSREAGPINSDIYEGGPTVSVTNMQNLAACQDEEVEPLIGAASGAASGAVSGAVSGAASGAASTTVTTPLGELSVRSDSNTVILPGEDPIILIEDSSSRDSQPGNSHTSEENEAEHRTHTQSLQVLLQRLVNKYGDQLNGVEHMYTYSGVECTFVPVDGLSSKLGLSSPVQANIGTIWAFNNLVMKQQVVLREASWVHSSNSVVKNALRSQEFQKFRERFITLFACPALMATAVIDPNINWLKKRRPYGGRKCVSGHRLGRKQVHRKWVTSFAAWKPKERKGRHGGRSRNVEVQRHVDVPCGRPVVMPACYDTLVKRRCDPLPRSPVSLRRTPVAPTAVGAAVEEHDRLAGTMVAKPTAVGTRTVGPMNKPRTSGRKRRAPYRLTTGPTKRGKAETPSTGCESKSDLLVLKRPSGDSVFMTMGSVTDVQTEVVLDSRLPPVTVRYTRTTCPEMVQPREVTETVGETSTSTVIALPDNDGNDVHFVYKKKNRCSAPDGVPRAMPRYPANVWRPGASSADASSGSSVSVAPISAGVGSSRSRVEGQHHATAPRPYRCRRVNLLDEMDPATYRKSADTVRTAGHADSPQTATKQIIVTKAVRRVLRKRTVVAGGNASMTASDVTGQTNIFSSQIAVDGDCRAAGAISTSSNATTSTIPQFDIVVAPPTPVMSSGPVISLQQNLTVGPQNATMSPCTVAPHAVVIGHQNPNTVKTAGRPANKLVRIAPHPDGLAALAALAASAAPKKRGGPQADPLRAPKPYKPRKRLSLDDL